jgi:dipeptidyl aminopeptidase/acylaminoacyl peptidase
MQNKLYFKILTFLVGVGMLIFGFWYLDPLSFFNEAKNSIEGSPISSRENSNSRNSGNFSNPSPKPFAEMTIPYLRQQNFESSIERMEELPENKEYISYLVSYLSDDLNINGLLTKPNGDMPQTGWPAIVFIHGYIPPSLYKTTERYEAYVDYLARNGFVVFKIDLRGHGKSEGNPGGAYYSSDYIVDTLNAYSALQSLDFVNPEAIGLWGHSMGANVILRSLAVNTDIPAAVVWSGTVFTYEDFMEYGIDDDSYRPPSEDSPKREERQTLFAVHGRFDLESEFWQKVSPVDYLGDIKGAIQLHHAVDDAVSSVEYSRNIQNLLGDANVNVELFEYSQGGHNIASPSFSVAMQRTVDFFENYLGE